MRSYFLLHCSADACTGGDLRKERKMPPRRSGRVKCGNQQSGDAEAGAHTNSTRKSVQKGNAAQGKLAGNESVKRMSTAHDRKQKSGVLSSVDQDRNPDVKKVTAVNRNGKKRKSDEKTDSPPKKFKPNEKGNEKGTSPQVTGDEVQKNGPVANRSTNKRSVQESEPRSKPTRTQKVQQFESEKCTSRQNTKTGKPTDSKQNLSDRVKTKGIAMETDSRVAETSSGFGSSTEKSQVIQISTNSIKIETEEDVAGTVGIMTDDSSSDSDFEEVQTQFRTPESSGTSLSQSDSAVSRKLEDSFSDVENSQSQDEKKAVKPEKTTIKNSAEHSASTRKEIAAAKSRHTQNKAAISSRPKKTTPSEQKNTKGNDSSSRKGGSGNVETGKRSKKAAKNLPAVSPKKKRHHSPKKMEENDVMAILLKMEGQASGVQKSVTHADGPSTSGVKVVKKKGQGKGAAASALLHSDSDGGSEWEEVADYKHSPVKSQIPDEPVQITINDPTMLHKKKEKKKFDWKAYVERRIRRLAKETQTEMHKVHLLCLLSFGMQQNLECNNPALAAVALSLVSPDHLKKRVARYDSEALLVVVRWFRSTFGLEKTSEADEWSVVNAPTLAAALMERMVRDAKQFVMALVAMLRSMGFLVRLVISLDPLPLKKTKSSESKHQPGSKRKIERKSSDGKNAGKSKTKAPASSKSSKTASGNKMSTSKTSTKSSRSTKEEKYCKKPQSHTKKSKKPECDSSSTSSSEDEDVGAKKRRPLRKRSLSKSVSSAKSRGAGDGSEDEPELNGFSDSGSNFSDEEDIKERKQKKGSVPGKGKKVPLKRQDLQQRGSEESDEEFEDSFSVRRSLVKKESATKLNRKILSEDSDTESTATSKVKKGRDYWLEVYLPGEQKWICVDCIRCAIGKPFDLSSIASQPLLYVLAFDNYGSVKDVTAKYAPQWLSHTRKQRVNADWWREALEPFETLNEELDQLENDNIKAYLMQRPLPTNIGEYKNHPLYALSRHLLKYEAIYPEGSIPVGYIRGEPVYARDCVHTLHSRDNWLREARVVRIGETAYKRVKSRKRWNKVNHNPEELDLELFGFWQTEKYIPPPAVNGKVPKNEYGNVELFQPSMLPGGTVHLQVPALNRVAKKLGIDIAAAMTGWDHHCGFSHPVLDGWVVCEEHKDILLAAWEEDQEIQRQRDEERREKRVLNNWTTLVRGLMIKDKLKKKFNLEEQERKAPPKTKKGASVKHGEVATDVQHAWPAKLQQEQKKKQNKGKAVPQPSHYTVETM